MPLRILVVEDDAAIAGLLTVELGRRGYEIRAVSTAAEAMESTRTWAPSLMLLDLGLPDRDGSDVLRQLRQRGDALPVICLTARDRQSDRVGELRAGADDYIVKPFDVAEVDARIRAVTRRTGHAGPQEIVVGGLRLLPGEMQVEATANSQPVGLTPRELHVMRRLFRNAGRVVTKQQLTETLAALNEDIGDKTIEVYIHRIRSKIQGHDAEIVTVRGFGYLLRQVLPPR
jgi:two-component system, OmpR family, response regulator